MLIDEVRSKLWRQCTTKPTLNPPPCSTLRPHLIHVSQPLAGDLIIIRIVAPLTQMQQRREITSRMGSQVDSQSADLRNDVSSFRQLSQSTRSFYSASRADKGPRLKLKTSTMLYCLVYKLLCRLCSREPFRSLPALTRVLRNQSKSPEQCPTE